MSMEQKYRFLDIGGGPDISGETDATTLRSTKLALSDPIGSYFILDPSIESFGESIPNLHIVKGEVNKDFSIPFRDTSFNVVEMSFVFVPLSTSRADQPLNPEEFQRWKEKELQSPNDVPLYARAIQESARRMHAGGRLILCEKKQRMDRIRRLLSKTPDLNVDSDFLIGDCGLEFVGLTEITDSIRSWWTERRLKEREDYLSLGDFEKAEESRVFRLN